MADEGQRLQKLLAAAGIASRRASEDLIAAGRVTVNGRVVKLGDRAVPTDRVCVDGEVVNVDPDRVYLLLNKPRGVLTTVDDPQGRPTVMDLINVPQRLFPVGRLDQDTEGLLLMTNDGELAHRLLHPSFGVERVYVALVGGLAKKRTLQELRAGFELEDGLAKPRRVRLLGEEGDSSLVEIVMTEGRKREVRRLLAAAGLRVERLARVSFANIELGDLRQGKWRFLDQQEIGRLHAAAAGEPRRKGSSPKAGNKSTKRQSTKSRSRGSDGSTSRGRR